jgi:general secretion pathway protein C
MHKSMHKGRSAQACFRRSGRQGGRITLPLVLALLLGLALIARVGLAVRELLVPEMTSAAATVPGAAQTARQKPDLAALQALKLFDQAGPGPATYAPGATLPAASTELNLRLEGVMLAGNPQNSVAIIVSNTRQGSYRVGEALPVGTNVRLEEVAQDHVIISNGGQREALWLFAEGESGPPAPASAISVPGTIPVSGAGAGGGAAAAHNLPPAAAQALDGLAATNPAAGRVAATLAEIITVSPAQQNGQLIGYRLTPGAKLKEFLQLGFRTNDVVTAVNGVALSDMANLPLLYRLMNEATEVSFSLLREGEPLTLQIALSP